MDTQKSFFIIVAIFIAGLLIGSSFTGQAVRRKPPSGGGPSPTCTDYDKDTYFGQSNCPTLQDCNDNNPNVHPYAEEICGNNLDDNCDSVSTICQGSIEIVARRSQYNAGEKVTLL